MGEELLVRRVNRSHFEKEDFLDDFALPLPADEMDSLVALTKVSDQYQTVF